MQPIVPLKTGVTTSVTHELWKFDDDGNLVPAPLAGAQSVKFKMTNRETGATVVYADATVVQADSEKCLVKYDLDAADTADPGDFYAEWQVVYADGVEDVFPLDGYIVVQIRARL